MASRAKLAIAGICVALTAGAVALVAWWADSAAGSVVAVMATIVFFVVGIGSLAALFRDLHTPHDSETGYRPRLIAPPEGHAAHTEC